MREDRLRVSFDFMDDTVVTLDVREHLNAGREPFSVIIQAVLPVSMVGSCANAGTAARVPASAAMIPVNPRRKPTRSIPAPLVIKA